MSKTRRRTVTSDTFNDTASGSANSQQASITVREFLSTLGQSHVPEHIVQTAVATIRPYADEIKAIIDEACHNLPDPTKFRPGQRPAFEIVVTDVSGSEKSYVTILAEFENRVTSEIMAGPRPEAGVFVARLAFNEHVWVVQAFQELTEDPASQVWFTDNMKNVEPAHRQYYYEVQPDGGTDLNRAVITAFALAKYVDHYYRSHNIGAKIILTFKTDGDHNGSMPRENVIATIKAANEFDNLYVHFVAVGAPDTAKYAKAIGFPDDAVLDTSKGEEAMVNAARTVSQFNIGASLSGKPASQFHYLSEIEAILAGETEQHELIQAGTRSNVFDDVFADTPPEEVDTGDIDDGS